MSWEEGRHSTVRQRPAAHTVVGEANVGLGRALHEERERSPFFQVPVWCMARHAISKTKPPRPIVVTHINTPRQTHGAVNLSRISPDGLKGKYTIGSVNTFLRSLLEV
eukprot:4732624-Pyramimonas_sp.AAC.2